LLKSEFTSGKTVVLTIVPPTKWLRPLSVTIRWQFTTSKECVTAHMMIDYYQPNFSQNIYILTETILYFSASNVNDSYN
jgi:hypothetical protein